MKTLVPSADEINEQHQLACRCAENAVEHAIECGRLLIAQKKTLKHGDWQQWITDHCAFGYSTAQRYVTGAQRSAKGIAFSALGGLFPSGKSETRRLARSEKRAQVPVTQQISTPRRDFAAQQKALAPQAPAPASDPFEDGAPAYTPDEDAALERALEHAAKALDHVIDSDDRFPAMHAEIKRLAGLLAAVEGSRDHYQTQAGEAVRRLKVEQRKVAALEKKLAQAQRDNEALRERVAIMEAA